MEQRLENISNILSKKRNETIEINGTINKSGILTYRLEDVLEFNNELDYKVSLISFESPASLPNIDSSNNKFYYSLPDQTAIKEITLDEGSYEITDYNLAIQNNLDDKDGIKISIETFSGKSIFTLKDKYKVYFNKAKTFAKQLGFKDEVITKSCKSPNCIDILKTSKIYIYCNIIKGVSMLIQRTSRGMKFLKVDILQFYFLFLIIRNLVQSYQYILIRDLKKH